MLRGSASRNGNSSAQCSPEVIMKKDGSVPWGGSEQFLHDGPSCAERGDLRRGSAVSALPSRLGGLRVVQQPLPSCRPRRTQVVVEPFVVKPGDQFEGDLMRGQAGGQFLM